MLKETLTGKKMQTGLWDCAKIIEVIKEFVFPFYQLIFKKEYFRWNTNGKKTIALTFDDGPDPLYTEKILEILERNSIKGTFFLIGEKVKQNPDITKKIVNYGHSIGIHTFTHRDLRRLTPIEIEEELLKTRKLIGEITGCSPNIIRPPEGRFNLKTIGVAKKAGLATILWSKSAKDYKMLGKEFIMKRINSKSVKPGDILLFHDNNEYTLEVLPCIISELKSNNFEFARIEP